MDTDGLSEMAWTILVQAAIGVMSRNIITRFIILATLQTLTNVWPAAVVRLN